MTEIKKRAIGFDLGHGESAVASIWFDSSDAPTAMEIGGKRTVLSVVGIGGDGTIRIGRRAVNHYPALELFIDFKSADVAKQAVREPISLFAGEIVRQVRENYDVGLEATTWFVGVPSNWTSDERAEYANVIAAAGSIDVQVVSESRAAMLHLRKTGESRVAEVELTNADIDQGVLIIDMGSSTTDYTWVQGREAKPQDDGHNQLGASLIDKEIMRRAIAAYDHPGLAAELRNGWNAPRLELACREAKENFFLDFEDASWDDERIVGRSEALLDSAKGERLTVPIQFAARDIANILLTPQAQLEGRSWLDAFREKLVNVVDQIGYPPQTVVLTGGASRMKFTRSICREVLGHDRVIQGQEPELTIAKGLARAARTSHLVKGFRADLDTFIASGEVRATVIKNLPELATDLGKAFASGKMEAYAIPAFLKWREGEITTLAGVTGRITKSIQDELAGPPPSWMNTVAARWQNGISAQLGESTRPICTRYNIPADALTLDQVEVRGTKVVPVVNTRSALDNIDQIGNLIVGIVGVAIFGVVAGVGIALALGGPITWMLAAGGGVFTLIVGKEAAMEALLAADLPIWVRQKVKSAEGLRAKLRQDANEFESKLAEAFTTEFAGKSGAVLQDRITKEVEEQLQLRADDAELNIA